MTWKKIVAVFMTAWIEICVSFFVNLIVTVAVFMTAWIEIIQKTSLGGSYVRCSLHDCMD